MKLRFLLFGIFLVMVSKISAQESADTLLKKIAYSRHIYIDSVTSSVNTDSGYVVTRNNDTLHGLINKFFEGALPAVPGMSILHVPVQMCNITFQNKNGEVIRYRADKLASFVVGNEKYVSIKPKGIPEYARVKIAGSLNLYVCEQWALNLVTKEYFLLKYNEYIAHESGTKFYHAVYGVHDPTSNSGKYSVSVFMNKATLASIVSDYPELKRLVTSDSFYIMDYLPIILIYNEYKKCHK